MPLHKVVLDANILITKVQLEMSKGFREFQESIPFSRETMWLFDKYSRRNVRFVVVPNVELTVLGRFRKETLLIHKLQKRISLEREKEFQTLEKFLRSSRIQLEDSIIKIAFLYYKEKYTYFQTFRKNRFEEIMKEKARDLRRLYYKILDKYNFEKYMSMLEGRRPDRVVEEFGNKILDETFIPYGGRRNKKIKYLEREDREILCDVFEYCQKFRRRDFAVIFLTNDKLIVKEGPKIENLGGSSFAIQELSELYVNEHKYKKLSD